MVAHVSDVVTLRERVASGSPSETFGSWSLSWQAIAERLSGDTAAAFEAFVLSGAAMSKDVSNAVGEVVLDWARAHGVTHFAHWFQPLTGIPAEKHDAFLSLKVGAHGAVSALDRLPGSLLLQGEPDASSFPNGGLRATHTARGYTVWDPTTPLFLRKEGNAPTLCVPCAYVSYTGHALDHKTPLLRALAALSREATRFLNLVSGSDSVTAVTATLGTEQEYFLVDRAHFAKRPDLLMAGRTLLGRVPSRNQQLEDHYFGPIPARVLAYMSEVEAELCRLGVPVKTRHCEVAPSQYEIAPIFESVSVACDHNVLTMDVMRRVAERHGLVCLMHEKPFAGINGSGKHNNWSMATDTGENLLEPSGERTRFLAVLSAVLWGVHRHAAVLRATVASAGNDHRLGANEAPPPIISAYLGSAIASLVEAAERGEKPELASGAPLAITEKLTVQLDATDRNRTAPFAFTGNKFEYRAVGSSENCAWPMTVLNAAVADAFRTLGDRLEAKLAKGLAREAAVLELAREALTESHDVRFEGNGYAGEWLEEATRRGLPVLKDTPAALGALREGQRTAFLVSQGVFSEEEIAARTEILGERYLKAIDIEAQTLSEIATGLVLPAIEAQAARTGEALEAFRHGGAKVSRQEERLHKLAILAESLLSAAGDLDKQRDDLFAGHDPEPGLRHASTAVVPAIARLRGLCDEAENLVGEALWPLPTYRQMLFPVL
ncbi:MAG TPA: glutamine synthetase III [Oscillatoriaceae cyanobacterium]